jgi:hypothetical protein
MLFLVVSSAINIFENGRTLMFVTGAAWKPDLSIVTAHTCATTGKEAHLLHVAIWI